MLLSKLMPSKGKPEFVRARKAAQYASSIDDSRTNQAAGIVLRRQTVVNRLRRQFMAKCSGLDMG